MMLAGAVAGGSGRRGVEAWGPSGTTGRMLSGQSGAPSTSSAPESRRMCARSIGPASGGTGTTGTPAARPAAMATTVASVGVALTATARAPTMAAPVAPAAAASSAHERCSPATATAPGSSPWVPARAGSSTKGVATPRR
jgi:hypothetical protein